MLNLMNISLSPKYQSMFDAEISRIKRISLGSVDLDPFRRTNHLIYACLSVLEPAIAHTYKCKDGCDFVSSHPPLCCLAVRFRGYKTRIPTMTISPIVILSKVLRQVADGYLRSDPRIKHSLEGLVEEELFTEKSGLWRSQDLTIATDMHQIEMTRSFYKCINPGVDWWDDVVNVVCNKYTIFTESHLKEYRIFRQTFIIGKYGFSLEHFLKDKFFKREFEKFLQSSDFVYDSELTVEPHWNNIHSRSGRVTRRGAPMGISSSWPILPLVSIFAFETSSNAPKIEINRSYYKPVDTFENLILSQTLEKRRKKVTVTRLVPNNFSLIRTTGDDAIMRIRKQHSLRHTKQIESVGSVVSVDKDFLSKHYAVYTEIFYLDGKKLPIYPLGPICGAYQDNKKLTWYSQPLSILNIEQKFKAKTCYKFSPFYYIWMSLSKLGCPIAADRLLKGLGLPRWPFKGLRRLSYQAKLLLKKEFNNLLGLDKDLPIDIDYQRMGLMTVPAKSPLELVSHLRNSRNREFKSNVTPRDLTTRTVQVPSPRISMLLTTWDSIFRMRNTWSQLYTDSFVLDEPSIYEYISWFETKDTSYTYEEILLFLEEIKFELNSTIEVPIGLYSQYKPTFGFLLPRIQCPVFYYADRNNEFKTNYIFFNKEF